MSGNNQKPLVLLMDISSLVLNATKFSSQYFGNISQTRTNISDMHIPIAIQLEKKKKKIVDSINFLKRKIFYNKDEKKIKKLKKLLKKREKELNELEKKGGGDEEGDDDEEGEDNDEGDDEGDDNDDDDDDDDDEEGEEGEEGDGDDEANQQQIIDNDKETVTIIETNMPYD